MKSRLLGSVCAVVLVAGAVPAAAEGSYFGFYGGANWLRGTMDLPGNPGPNFDQDFSTGFTGMAVFGLLMATGWRLEAEAGYRNSPANFTRFDTVPFMSDEGVTTGNAQLFTFMANGWYDFGAAGAFRPYVGGGIGVAGVHASLFSDDGTFGSGTVSGSQFVFAYQLGVGVGYAVNPNLTLSLDYRFLGTSPVSMPFDTGGAGLNGPLYNHSVMVGARFYLGPH